jgi:methyl-accepting chemotaxis protein
MFAPSFQSMPFRAKLTVLVITATALALVLVGVAVVAFDYVGMREGILREVRTEADISANNSTAALAFDDQDTATEVLAALQADPNLVAAATYTADGRLFATYRRPDHPDDVPIVPPTVGHSWESDHLIVVRPVEMDGETIGTVALHYDLSELYMHLLRQALIVLAALAASLVISLLLTRRLVRVLVRPVRHLAETARQVSAEKDYGLRAEKSTHDEMGELTDAFNRMLSEIQERDAELQNSRDQLEVRVRERTSDLVQAQEKLAERVEELEQALAEVKKLRGLLPICSYCKRIREGEEYTKSVEAYLAEHSDAKFSHGVCSECYERYVKPELDKM